MSAPGGAPASVDRRAVLIGRLCAAVCIACLVVGAALLLLLAGDVVAPRTWPWLALAGIAVGAWSIAFWTMTWHQQRVALPAADADDWERRTDARFGFLVPFAYLLASPDQRRVARYAKRTRRRLER